MQRTRTGLILSRSRSRSKRWAGSRANLQPTALVVAALLLCCSFAWYNHRTQHALLLYSSAALLCAYPALLARFNYILENTYDDARSLLMLALLTGSEVNYDDRDWHKPHKPPDCIDCVHQSVQKVKQAQAQTQRDTEAGVSETGGHKRQKEH
jgi:hypothetical protein